MFAMSEWVRDREQSGVILVAVMGSSAVLLIMATLGPRDPLPLLFFTAAWSWFGIGRCSLAGVRVEETGLRIRNPLRTHRVQWGEIVGIKVGSKGIWPRVALVELVGGRSVHIWGLQGPNPLTRPKSEWKLNAEVDRLRQLMLEHGRRAG
jgi:hypothetical protein